MNLLRGSLANVKVWSIGTMSIVLTVPLQGWGKRICVPRRARNWTETQQGSPCSNSVQFDGSFSEVWFCCETQIRRASLTYCSNS
jgi:hypothetical protein